VKILVVDPGGFALDFCMRAQNAGHDIRWFVKDTVKTEHIGNGLVEKLAVWQPSVRWADWLFLADNATYLVELDRLRAQGVPIWGPTEATANLELDRTAGLKLLADHGMDCLPFKEFETYDPAIAYVKREMRRFVSKPCGNEPNKALSYVSKSPADLVYMLERWKKASKLKGSFILQDFVGGCEMAVGGFFGPGGFNEGWCENWEFKKLMVGDLGVATGEQGTVLRFVKKSKLADMVLKPLEGWLEDQGYTGYIDVNCIIDDEGTPWPLELTCRPGWPTFNIQQALNQSDDPVAWIAETLDGKDPKNFALDQVAVGMCMSIPDYPYSHMTRKEVVGIPLYGLKPSIAANVHPCEMMLGEAPHEVQGKIVNLPTFVSAGDYILVTTGLGDTVKAAKQQALRVMKTLEMPNSPMYRTDIGDRLKKQLPICQRFGFAKGLQWAAPSG
jgi:phosphoribosylamine--glycine ligase